MAGSRKVFIEEMPGLDVADAFRVDRRRDADNLVYGASYARHVARHRRVGDGCLGASAGRWATMAAGRKRRRPATLRELRYFGRENAAKRKNAEKSGDAVRAEVKTVAEDAGKMAEYIALGTPAETAEKAQRAANPLGVYDASTALYAAGMAPSASLTTAAEPTDVGRDDATDRRAEQYNRRLRESPNDVDLWLEFARFQDGRDDAAAAVTRSVRDEIRAAVFERALAANPTSVRLALARIAAHRDAWDGERTRAEWRRVAFAFPNEPLMWRDRLRDAATEFGHFSVGGVLKLYAKCFKCLDGVLRGTMKSHALRPNTAACMVGTCAFRSCFSNRCYCCFVDLQASVTQYFRPVPDL